MNRNNEVLKIKKGAILNHTLMDKKASHKFHLNKINEGLNTRAENFAGLYLSLKKGFIKYSPLTDLKNKTFKKDGAILNHLIEEQINYFCNETNFINY